MAVLRTLPVLAAVLALCCGHVVAYTIHHRMLLLSKPGFADTDWLETSFGAYGIPYDLVRIDSTNVQNLATTAFWYNSDGSAKYSAIAMTPAFEGDGTMNKAQVTAMWAYMTKNNVRGLIIGGWPGSYGYNVGARPDGNLACSAGAASATFAPGLTAANFSASGVNPAAALPMSGLYRCPGTTPTGYCALWASDFASGLGGPCTVAPVLQTPPDATVTSYAGLGTTAWTVNTFDGRELLVATHDCAAWSPACLAFGHFAVGWLTKGVIPGSRRATLNAQADDFFLTTDTEHQLNFRIKPSDLMAHQTWFKNLTTFMPAGSNFTVDFAFNGFGIFDFYDADKPENDFGNINNEDCYDNVTYGAQGCNCYLMDYFAGTCQSSNAFCIQCQKNWPKPLGTGTTQMIDTFQNYASAWDKNAMIAGDDLFAVLWNNTNNLAESFHWNHHTWTHQNMDNITLQDATLQMQLNQQMAGPAFLNFTSRSTWSDKAMVTPQISGLANGDALQAMYNAGIRAIMGDSTFPYLLNKDQPYWVKYTTLASSNYAGFPIIPRYATEIYFNCSTAKEDLDLYQKVYPTTTLTTFAQILDAEANRVLQGGLLQVRHDAHMFHQANLNTVGTGITGMFGQPASLLMAWVERIVTEHKKYVNWPLVSWKANDVWQAFQDRQARDTCNFDYTLNIDGATGAIQTVAVAALSGSCNVTAPLMVPAGASVIGAKMEQLGSEPPTFWTAPNGAVSSVTGGLVWGPQAASR